MTRFQTVLAATDYSACADCALEHAATLAHQAGARLVVLHVLPAQAPARDPSNLWGSGQDTVTKEKERLAGHVATLLAAAATGYQIEVRWGIPAAAIIECARDCKSDLIVIGAQGLSHCTDAVLGSVAEGVVRGSPCAVLTVPSPQPRQEMRPEATDVRRAACAAEPLEATIGEVIQSTPVTITQDETLAAAHALMLRHGVHQLPVVEHGTLIGIVAERDLHAHFGYLERTKVDAVMTRAPLTVSPTESPQQAARILIEQHINALPVVQGDRLVGVVSRTDLLRVLVNLLDRRKGARK